MLDQYKEHVEERRASGVVPNPLDAGMVEQLCELLVNTPRGEEALVEDLITNRVPPGVDDAARVKADFLFSVATGEKKSPIITPERAVTLLGTMVGGYNVSHLVALLDHEVLAAGAAKALSSTLLVFDAFDAVVEKSQANPFAMEVLQSWAAASWFMSRAPLPEKITLTVFKVDGEINTDDLSPAAEAWSRPDIPLHALSMLQSRMENPLGKIEELKEKGYPLVFAGDVMGTGSSRKSATNSVLWYAGNEIPFVPNKKQGGFVLGGKIAPIFFNTLEDAGALPIECDVSSLSTGDVVSIHPYGGVIVNEETGETVSEFTLKTAVLLDEVRAGGRIPLIVGRSLTEKARTSLGLAPSDVFAESTAPEESGAGFTLAQKMVGRACGTDGIRPGTYCEPKITTVGSQDTTGPMTRDELKELACLGFTADLVMQSFCHTAAYPKLIDIAMHKSMPGFFTERGGVALKPGDGVIHSWLNRMILPDTVGTGGDSHTRFPIGISFPAGSGLVAFAAAMGSMPLDMPESVLVRFKGEMQPGITLRDLVNAIPYAAIEKGLLTVEKEGKKNIFSGRIIEIEGLEHLNVDQAFEITDSSAERSAAACAIKLGKDKVVDYLKSNVCLLKKMVKDGYSDRAALERRICAMEEWLENPELLEADPDAEYKAVVEVDLDKIREPLLACPNDPDDVKTLSEVAGEKVDEVFVGSCMTSIAHFRAAATLVEGHGKLPVRMWVAPPTMMDAAVLRDEGLYNVLGSAGARMEIAGCSLCMGNQARVNDNAVVVSTSTRNFPNRIGDGANVFLGSSELAAICAVLGRIPDMDEYREHMKKIEANSASIYRYLQFDQMEGYGA